MSEIVGIPEGYKAVAFRVPKIGETYLSQYGVQKSTFQYTNRYLVVEKIPQPTEVKLYTYLVRDEDGYSIIECDEEYAENTAMITGWSHTKLSDVPSRIVTVPAS